MHPRFRGPRIISNSINFEFFLKIMIFDVWKKFPKKPTESEKYRKSHRNEQKIKIFLDFWSEFMFLLPSSNQPQSNTTHSQLISRISWNSTRSNSFISGDFQQVRANWSAFWPPDSELFLSKIELHHPIECLESPKSRLWALRWL